MDLRISVRFDPDSDESPLLASLPQKPAVFALFPGAGAQPPSPPPYLGRTRDLRRRMARLLRRPGPNSRMLNLRDFTRRIDYQPAGSGFEAQWLLYLLNRDYYPHAYRQRLRLKPPALLKLNLANRFPRLYPTRRISDDGSLYYGPFPSRVGAERLAAEFLDFFKIRRCVEDLTPDPSHPGCIYSQMRMCLAPCFAGCTDQEYRQEVSRVTAFLDAEGQPLVRALEAERAGASESLEFEQAAKIHRRLEKLHDVLRAKPDLARNLRELHALVIARGAEEKTIVFFRVSAGEIRGPATLALDENVSAPVPLDEHIHTLLDSLAAGEQRDARTLPRAAAPGAAGFPLWEHLSLFARWYFSSFREGELVMLPPGQQIPHARIIRVCRKILAAT